MWRIGRTSGRLRHLSTPRRTSVARLFSSGASAPTGLSSRRMAGVAVGCLAAVSAGAVYDLTSRWMHQNQDDEEWSEDWEEELADDREVPSEIAASFVVARELRQAQNPGVGARHLIFIRHAQPGEGSEKPLSETGLQQAELVATRLASQINDMKYKVIFHSPAAEAKATAKIIKKSLGKVALKESSLLAEGIPLVPSPAPDQLQKLPEQAIVGDLSRAEGALRTHLVRQAMCCPEDVRETNGYRKAQKARVKLSETRKQSLFIKRIGGVEEY